MATSPAVARGLRLYSDSRYLLCTVKLYACSVLYACVCLVYMDQVALQRALVAYSQHTITRSSTCARAGACVTPQRAE